MPTATAPSALRAEEQKLIAAVCTHALRLVQEGAPLREVLAQLTSVVETLAKGQTVASILVLDRDGLLRNGASPNLPADYLDAIDRLKPNPMLGTCAAAAATGQVVDTPSFYDDEKWAELRHLPLALGFVGAWSMPILSPDRRVLGTFGTYFREQRLPTPAERETVRQLVAVAADAITARKAA